MNLPWDWSFEPAVIACLVAVSLVYAAGTWRLARERRSVSGARSRGASFIAGVALLVVALLSPLDAWADRLFAAHMTQHLILMMLAPPLLVLGRPVAVALWALPRDARRAVARWWLADRGVRPAVGVLRAPLTAWLASSAALWFWHLPKPYAFAFDDGWAHALEHLTFFFAGILFWRIVLEHPQSRRLSLGAAMLFVATFAMQNGMLGAILIFAPRALYAVHAVAPPWSPLNPLEDQQAAGILMWVVSGTVDLVAIGVLFVAWLGSSERRAVPT